MIQNIALHATQAPHYCFSLKAREIEKLENNWRKRHLNKRKRWWMKFHAMFHRSIEHQNTHFYWIFLIIIFSSFLIVFIYCMKQAFKFNFSYWIKQNWFIYKKAIWGILLLYSFIIIIIIIHFVLFKFYILHETKHFLYCILD